MSADLPIADILPNLIRALRAQGADLAVTFLNDKAEKYVRPLAEQLEAKIILSDGRLVTATRDNEYKDLLWAVMGAGGGKFGVVVELTVRLHRMKALDSTTTWPTTTWLLTQRWCVSSWMMDAMEVVNSLPPRRIPTLISGIQALHYSSSGQCDRIAGSVSCTRSSSKSG